MTRRLIVACAILLQGFAFALVGTGLSLAQHDATDEEPAFKQPYRDDRSTPETVIASYYNAISRQEYARAYSYYGESAAPSDYDRWQRGYADTLAVSVRFGAVSEEGAAGSIHYNVPVKLDVETTAGQPRYFSGCYVIRLANPSIQAVPFVPMHIEGSRLRRSTRRSLPPANCR
jgi:hypothetical protein